MTKITKSPIFWLALATLFVAMLIHGISLDAADGAPYSVSLNSPAKFLVDI